MGKEVTELDLDAYVDGELDMRTRVEIEDYLRRHPAEAAEVMAKLFVRDRLRLAFREVREPASPQDEARARELTRAFAWRQRRRSILRAAAVVLLLAAGWGLHSLVGLGDGMRASASSIDYVDEALDAYRNSILRRVVAALPAGQGPAAGRGGRGLGGGASLPPLPADWTLLDVEIVPWDSGSAVELTLAVEELGIATLFAARAGETSEREPGMTQAEDAAAVYWHRDAASYALCGAAPSERLLEAAAMLNRESASRERSSDGRL